MHPEYRGRKVGTALLRQLSMNLRALGIETVETLVEWNDWDLLRFLESRGFRPSPRVSLSCRLER